MRDQCSLLRHARPPYPAPPTAMRDTGHRPGPRCRRLRNSWPLLRSYYRPARFIGQTGALDDGLTSGLYLGIELVLVDHGAAVIVDHSHPVDPNTVHAPAIRRPNQLVGHVEQRPPFRPVGIVEDEIGFLAWLQRADLMVQTHGT